MGLNEADTREKLVKERLTAKNWSEDHLHREYPIRSDRFYVKGEDYEIVKVKKKYADFALKVNNVIVAVVEVKEEDLSAEKGISQAKDYSQRLDVPIAYATNGRDILLYDRRIPHTIEVNDFLSPDEIYGIYKEWKGLNVVDASPLEHPAYIYPDKKIRSYQDTAIKNVIEAFIKGQKKCLLTMATGAGKTFTAFQIVWKLVKSNHFSRVLFLTDRVFLKDQAHDNDFEPFKDARHKIEGGSFNKNRKIYFSTYQTLYADRLYEQIPKDFFDLIIIDECHRSRYGDWGEILTHFETAHHLGMTATPKREDNIDVYEYFGEPVFQYSMALAIQDGYLVPYKIYKIFTNLDIHGVDISQAEEVLYDDEIDRSQIKDIYMPPEFERDIILPDRTRKMCEKFTEIFKRTDKFAKTIIFCVDTDHAERVMDELNRLNGSENYATKIVYEDKDDLTIFRDAERPYPAVATTVDLLSTGIDIPHLKNIVFMRGIGSRVLFKQIIGRGSRLSDSKGFFRIIDFTNATRLIDDWDIPLPPDGPPEPPEMPQEPFDKTVKGYVIEKETKQPVLDAKARIMVGRWEKETMTDKNGHFILEALPSNPLLSFSITHSEYVPLRRRIKAEDKDYIFELKSVKRKPRKLTAKGIEVEISEEITINLDGNAISFAEYKKYAKDNVLERIHTLDELRTLWVEDRGRKEFISRLEEKYIDFDLIRNLENMDDADSFDVMAHLVFDAPLLTRDERVKHYVNAYLYEFEKYGEDIKDIVFAMLQKYKKGGIDTLTPEILTFEDMKKRMALDRLKEKVGTPNIPAFFSDIKNLIYRATIHRHI